VSAPDEPSPPALIPHARTPDPRAAVLVLHGGRSEGLEAPPQLNLPGARMRLFLPSLARASAGHGVLLCRVRYRCRGWNGEREDAARDARWALHELARTVGELPTVVVGHSMGGRAALRVGGASGVRGVVALAPWCPEGEPVRQLSGRRAVLVHGDRDRVTDPAASRRFVHRARKAGADAGFVAMPGGDHAMLRRPAAWHRTVAEEVMGMLGLGMSAARRSPRGS
jgi:predicted esterase